MYSNIIFLCISNSIEGHLSRALLVRPLNLRAVIVRRRGNQRDQDQGQDPRERRKKKSIGQEPSILATMVKKVVALCRFLNSLEV